MSYTRLAYDSADASWEGAAEYTRPAYNDADASWEVTAITADAVIAVEALGGVPASREILAESSAGLTASYALLLDLVGQPQDIQATFFAKIERTKEGVVSPVLLLDSWAPVPGESTETLAIEYIEQYHSDTQLGISRDSPIAVDTPFFIETNYTDSFALELPIRFEELIGADVSVLVERQIAVNADKSTAISWEEAANKTDSLLLEQLADEQHAPALLLETLLGTSAPVGLFIENTGQQLSDNRFVIALFSQLQKTNVFSLEALSNQLSALATIPIEQLHGDVVATAFSIERFVNVHATQVFWLDVDTRNAAVLCTELQKLGVSYELAVQLAETALTTGMVLIELSANTMDSTLQRGSVERLLRHNTLTIH